MGCLRRCVGMLTGVDHKSVLNCVAYKESIDYVHFKCASYDSYSKYLDYLKQVLCLDAYE